jgi:hypothetical protein
VKQSSRGWTACTGVVEHGRRCSLWIRNHYHENETATKPQQDLKKPTTVFDA